MTRDRAVRTIEPAVYHHPAIRKHYKADSLHGKRQECGQSEYEEHPDTPYSPLRAAGSHEDVETLQFPRPPLRRLIGARSRESGLELFDPLPLLKTFLTFYVLVILQYPIAIKRSPQSEQSPLEQYSPQCVLGTFGAKTKMASVSC